MADNGVYEVSVQGHFAAAHHLAGYQGQCEAVHGHNWDIEVFVRGAELDATGLLVDFRILKQALREALADLDHTDLNAHPVFQSVNPSSEHLARYLHGELSRRVNSPRCRVHRVAVNETRGARASYTA